MPPRAFLLSAFMTSRALCRCQRKKLPLWPFALGWCGWVVVVVTQKIFSI